MTALTLALDLEGTLISNAVSQIPRPGLAAFLSRCRALFPRIVIFTSVPEERFRPIAETLVLQGHAPDWFATLECVHWKGTTKDLRFVPNNSVNEVVLVDDCTLYLHPGQEAQWVHIEPFEYRSTTPETTAFADVLRELERRVMSQMLERLKSPVLHVMRDMASGKYFWIAYLGMGDWHAERIQPGQHQAIELLIAAGDLFVDYTRPRYEPLVEHEIEDDGIHERHKGDWVRGYMVGVAQHGAAPGNDAAGQRPKLGLDVGRVIISAVDGAGSEDTSFFGRTLRDAQATPPYEGMFERLPAVVQHFEGRVWLISKAHAMMQGKTRAWLEQHRFFECTGIAPHNLCFCFERPEKALICRQLGITHFIDDRLDVLEHLEGIVRRRYLFGPQAPGVRLPKGVTWLQSWEQVRPATFRLRRTI